MASYLYIIIYACDKNLCILDFKNLVYDSPNSDRSYPDRFGICHDSVLIKS
jgi:hypothetical protein